MKLQGLMAFEASGIARSGHFGRERCVIKGYNLPLYETLICDTCFWYYC